MPTPMRAVTIGQAGGHERPEGEDEHERGDGDADELGAAARRGEALHAGAVDLGGEAGVARGVESRQDRVLRGGLDIGDGVDVEAPRHRADATVGAQWRECGRVGLGLLDRLALLARRPRPAAVRWPSAAVTGLTSCAPAGAVGGGHLRLLAEPGDEVLDLGGVDGVGQLLSLGRREDHRGARLVERVTGLREELLLELLRLLGGDPGDRERVDHRPRDGRRDATDGDERDEPGSDEVRPTAVCRPPESVEVGRHGGAAPWWRGWVRQGVRATATAGECVDRQADPE